MAAKALLDFLRELVCEAMFLVCDMIDGWHLRPSLLLAAIAQ